MEDVPLSWKPLLFGGVSGSLRTALRYLLPLLSEEEVLMNEAVQST